MHLARCRPVAGGGKGEGTPLLYAAQIRGETPPMEIFFSLQEGFFLPTQIFFRRQFFHTLVHERNAARLVRRPRMALPEIFVAHSDILLLHFSLPAGGPSLLWLTKFSSPISSGYAQARPYPPISSPVTAAAVFITTALRRSPPLTGTAAPSSVAFVAFSPCRFCGTGNEIYRNQ